MISEEVNKKALNLLYNQNWEKAQVLLFENARKNPSLETYNNLGYFLISEGIACKNGTFRNAHKLGLRYLLRANVMEDSVINLCALAEACDYEMKTASKQRKKSLYKQSFQYLDKALEIKYSDVLYYNYLRLSALLNPDDLNVLNGIRDLIKKFVCEESIALYFQLLGLHALVDEGLQCIEKYGELLDKIDLLMFYTKYKLYEQGYCLCKEVCEQYNIDKYTASAIIECCINTGNLEDARIYAQWIIKNYEDTKYPVKVFRNLGSSLDYRKKLVSAYQAIPPFISSCCYYGCIIHKTPWRN